MNAVHQWALRLPRETRDTLFLIGILSVLVFQMSRSMLPWVSAYALAILAWRTWIAVRAKPLPGRWQRMLALALALAMAVFELVGNTSTSGAALTLLLMLLSIKTLEMHSRRDSMVLFFLAFFCIVTTFLFAQAISVALLMVLVFWGLVTALINANKPVGRPALKESALAALQLMLIGLPLVAALYVLFPRFPPLWGIPNTPGQARTGLSGSMQVGTITNLAQNREIALRLEFAPGSPVPKQSQMYFRGPVLSRLEGRMWRAQMAGPVQPQAPAGSALNPMEPRGPAVRYTAVIEPHQQHWLLPLELGMGEAQDSPPNNAPGNTPLADAPRSMLSTDLTWNSFRTINTPTRYQAISYPNAQQGRHIQPRNLQLYVQLPEGDNPRTRAWAQELRAQFAHLPKEQADPALVNHVLDWLRREPFHYTLQPPLYGDDTADDFWFVHRRGFCEHIASAYAILMRAADIPARIITGYQGGEANPVNGVWTVRQSDAHAWVEVWLSGQGWVRIDPTGAIAPERIELSQSGVLEGGGEDVRAGNSSWRWLLNLQAMQDAIDYRWTQWVINYDQRNQASLMERLGLQRLNWQQMTLVAVALMMITGLAYLLWPLLRRRRDPWLHLLGQTRSKLAAAGLDLPAHLPPGSMAKASREFFGQSAGDVSQWLLDMDALRYAPRSTHTLAELTRRWRTLRWPQSCDSSDFSHSCPPS